VHGGMGDVREGNTRAVYSEESAGGDAPVHRGKEDMLSTGKSSRRMMTNEEKRIVHAYLETIVFSDVRRVVVLNAFPILFAAVTGVGTIWYYISWFLVCSFVVASFGLSVGRVVVTELELTGNVPRDIVTPKRCALLIVLQAGIVFASQILCAES